MKKTLKRIGALALVLCMLVAVSVTAFAANTADTYQDDSQTTVSGNNIPLVKSIVLFNTDGSEIREPNISFSYAVAPVDATEANQGKLLMNGTDPVTVTDDGEYNSNVPVTMPVYDGVAAAFTTSLTLSFADTNAKVAAAKTGTEVEKSGNLVVVPSAFPHAGIYRFVITETADPTDITLKGLDARDTAYTSTRYLDVYIKNGTSGLELYGAVIFKSTTGTDSITTTTDKTPGFEPGSTDYENDKTVDKYHTFNLVVNKTTTGSLADLTHDFPFEITLTGDKAATIITDYSKSGATYVGTEPTTVNINTTAAVLTPALSNGDSVTITGIPVGTTVMVKETNDTYDKYTPSLTTQTGFTGLDLTVKTPMDALTGSTQLTAADPITINDKTQNSVIGLTNNLTEISPTGVVLRFAPYAMILAAGIVLLLLSIRRRRLADDEA